MMLMKQKLSIKKETVIGLRIVRAAIQGYISVDKVPITLDQVKAVENHIGCIISTLGRNKPKKTKASRKTETRGP